MKVVVPNCKCIVAGSGEGELLISMQPLNFLAMVNSRDGTITDPKNELFGKTFAGKVLAYPFAIGSSVGAYIFYSLRANGKAPSAIICSKADITTASGCAISKIPLVELPNDIKLLKLEASSYLFVNAIKGTISERL